MIHGTWNTHTYCESKFECDTLIHNQWRANENNFIHGDAIRHLTNVISTTWKQRLSSRLSTLWQTRKGNRSSMQITKVSRRLNRKTFQWQRYPACLPLFRGLTEDYTLMRFFLLNVNSYRRSRQNAIRLQWNWGLINRPRGLRIPFAHQSQPREPFLPALHPYLATGCDSRLAI